MSPLTKVFVVLLVVLSILFVSGTIVFVNRSEDYKVALAGEKQNGGRLAKQVADLNTEMQGVREQSTADLQAKEQQLQAARDELRNAQNTINTLNGQVAELQSDKALSTAASASTAEALKLAQGRLATQQDQLNEARAAADKAERQYTDATMRIGDLENRLQVTERARRQLAEENTQLLADRDRQRSNNKGAVANAGGQPGDNTPVQPDINIIGKVRDKRMIAGVPYATIDIGSAEQVTKNMQFKVIQGTQFLGYLTVDTVEPHEASGRLDGPRVSDIKGGDEVRTQL